MSRRPKKPVYLSRPLDFALDVLQFHDLLRAVAADHASKDESLARLERWLRHMLAAASEVVEWERGTNSQDWRMRLPEPGLVRDHLVDEMLERARESLANDHGQGREPGEDG